MNSYITVIIYALVSFGMILLMMRETNRKINVLNSDEDVKIDPYQFSWKTYVCVFLLTGISAVCGYIVLERAVLTVGVIELYTCYLAVLAAAIMDLKTRTIPNYISIGVVIIRIVIFIYELMYHESALGYMMSSLIGCSLCAFLLIITNRIARGGIGAGDIKLLSGIGFLCGIYVIFSILLMALVSCMFTSFVLVAAKKNNLKDSLPFGPFIFAGTVIVYLFTFH